MVQLVGEDFTEKVKKVPPLGWVVIAGVVIGVIVLKGKGGGSTANTAAPAGTVDSGVGGGSAVTDSGSGTSSTGGLSEEDLTNFLQAQAAQNTAFQGQIATLIGGVKPPTPATPPAGSTAPKPVAAKPVTYALHVGAHVPVFSTTLKKVTPYSKATNVTATIVKVKGKSYYRFKSPTTGLYRLIPTTSKGITAKKK